MIGVYTIDMMPSGVRVFISRISEEGRDCLQVGYCMEAADKLKEVGISAEVINLRSLKPLDRGTVLSSVAKTHRCG